MTRRRIAGPRRERLSAARIIVAAVALAVALKAFAFDLVIVRGDSMSPTIGSGAVAVVSPCAYGLRLPLSGSYLVRWGEPAPGDVVLVSPFPPERVTPSGPLQGVCNGPEECRLATRLQISGDLTDAQMAELQTVAQKCPVHKLMTTVTTEISTSVERLA